MHCTVFFVPYLCTNIQCLVLALLIIILMFFCLVVLPCYLIPSSCGRLLFTAPIFLVLNCYNFSLSFSQQLYSISTVVVYVCMYVELQILSILLSIWVVLKWYTSPIASSSNQADHLFVLSFTAYTPFK